MTKLLQLGVGNNHIAKRRQCGRAVRALNPKSGRHELRSRPDHQLDLHSVVPRLNLGHTYKIANWFASYQLGFLVLL